MNVADPRLARPDWRGRRNVDALTIACIEHAEQLGAGQPGAHQLVVIKGSYQPPDGKSPSAHTHDLGGVVDLEWCGHDTCVRNLRRAGMAAWHRTPEQGNGKWIHHVHAVVIGHPLRHSSAIAQVGAYFARFNGLDGSADDGPQLDPIPRPVWPWPPQEEDMPLNDQDFEKLTKLLDLRIRAATPDIVKALLDAPVDDDPATSVRKALRQAAQP
jgi:hypothetical protein